MTTTTVSRTAEVLAGMFTENTGRHMLDSGGHLGRNWERNQGRDVQSFLDEPDAYFVTYGSDEWYVQRSTFHFLNDRLEFNAEVQAEFDALAESRPNDPWAEVLTDFMDERYTDAQTMVVNTYNHENVLDGVIQYWQIAFDGDPCYPDLIILEVHGGCDVRGGYTAPKFFTPIGENEVGLLDDNDINVSCVGCEPPQNTSLPGFPAPEKVYHRWYSDDSGYHWYSDDGYATLTNESTDDDGNPLCPECGAKLEVFSY